jgi:hypothetical protein
MSSMLNPSVLSVRNSCSMAHRRRYRSATAIASIINDRAGFGEARVPGSWHRRRWPGPAPADAVPIALGDRLVRHTAAAVDQAGGPHRGLEDEGSPAPATGDARSGVVRVAADAHAAPQNLIHGADCPHLARCRLTPAPASHRDNPTAEWA